jgi:hypothetical protein
MRRLLVLVTMLGALVAAPSAHAAFGVTSFDLTFTEANGSPDFQAGSHPFAVTNLLGLNSRLDPEFGEVPEGQLKSVSVTLPEGLVGDPLATPRCPSANFVNINFSSKFPACSNDSVVGVVSARVLWSAASGANWVSAPLYNLQPPFGVVQKLGFAAAGVPIAIEFRLSQKAPYKVIANLNYLAQPLPILGSRVVVWGNPSSPAHNAERGTCIKPLVSEPTDEIHTTGGSCPSTLAGTAAEKAFITLPTACRGPLATAFRLAPWENPEARVEGAILTHDNGVPPVAMGFENCPALQFGPRIGSKPTSSSADSPTGLDFEMNIEDKGLTTPGENGQSDLKKAVVTLPAGMTTNPAVASGLQACTLAQYESETVDSVPGTGCPEASKVGSVEIESPLVEPVIHGSVFVAKQGDNPFHNLLTIYMVAKSPELGVIVQAAGKVDPDPTTGQLTTTFDDLPQLPFSHFRFHFRDGDRAPLITPSVCDKFTTTADLYPYSNPTVPLHETATFEVTSGTKGRPCASSEGQLPLRASFSAGTTSPLAGAYSPFVLKLEREDGTQEISRINTTMPKGFTGRLVGIPYCPEAGIAQAAARSGEGQAALEIAHPSCPAASELGSVVGSAGAGPKPFYLSTGHAYLAGPYKGAPLSLEIIVPVVAGPFDLGVVAVRTALQVDLKTAQITAVSDPIPTIIHGLPLVVRSIALNVSRPNFTLNPTSCAPKEITGTLVSTLNQSTPLSQYFQVEACKRLKFKPTLHIHLQGPTRRAGHPALKAVVTYPKKGAYSNVARAQVGLPHSEFLDQGSIGTVCTQPQLQSKTCPKKSIYGRVKAWTPLLEKPLSGPVYLGVGYGHKLPDLVADLGGQIRVLLNGKVDQTKQKGLRNTFEAVPDAPVSKFILELKGGPKYGLLENSENICRKAQKASTRFVAQNGMVLTTQTPIANECKKAKKKGSRKHGGKGGRR